MRVIAVGMLAALFCALLFPLTGCASETDVRSVLNENQLNALQDAANTLTAGEKIDIVQTLQAALRGEKILDADELCEKECPALKEVSPGHFAACHHLDKVN